MRIENDTIYFDKLVDVNTGDTVSIPLPKDFNPMDPKISDFLKGLGKLAESSTQIDIPDKWSSGCNRLSKQPNPEYIHWILNQTNPESLTVAMDMVMKEYNGHVNPYMVSTIIKNLNGIK